MEKAMIGFEELIGELKKKNTKDRLEELLNNKNSYHIYSLYDNEATRQDYFLVYLKNGIAKIPYWDVFYGNGWHRFDLESAEMLNESHVDYLKESIENYKVDIKHLKDMISYGKISTYNISLDVYTFIDELEKKGNYTEDTLDEFFREESRNEEEDIEFFLNIVFPDEFYLGYFAMKLNKKPFLIPYRTLATSHGLEQLDVGAMRYVDKSDTNYLKKALAYMEKGVENLKFSIEKQRIRKLF